MFRIDILVSGFTSFQNITPSSTLRRISISSFPLALEFEARAHLRDCQHYSRIQPIIAFLPCAQLH